MKHFTVILFFSFFTYHSYGQSISCDSAIKGTSCDTKAKNYKDGSGFLGLTYNNTACGLNYVQASNMTTTRYTSNPGSGFPTALAIFGIPNAATILQAYVWWGCSNTTPNPNFTFNGVNMVGTIIGVGAHKCWGLGGSENYRGDVTSEITGNGTYTFESPIGDLAVDGVTLMVIYLDSNAIYQSTLQINDGNMTNNTGSAETQTMNGLNICANSTFGEAFIIVGDMQDNVVPPTHTATLNGATTSFRNDFWNFNLDTVNFTSGQTSSNFGVVPDGGGDCYDWVAMGVYYQHPVCSSCSTIGISENKTFGLTIYPNPTRENITIISDAVLTNPKLSIRNSLGQVLLIKSYTSTNEIQVELDVPIGIYFLQIEANGKIITKKIIKQK